MPIVRFLKNSVIGLFLVCLTFGLLVYAGSIVSTAVVERMENQPQSRPVRERIYAVNVVVAAAESVIPKISSFGEVRSLRTLEVRAPVGGAIIELSPNFVEGGVIESGEFILAVDPSDAQSAVDLALADQQDAEVQRNDAVRELALAREELSAADRQTDLRMKALERQEQLRERGVGTDIAVENAELVLSSAEQAALNRKKLVAQAATRVEQAESLVERRGIGLKEARRKLKETRLVAEFTGTLSNVNLVQGGLVNANERVAQLVDPDQIEVSFRVSNEQYARTIGTEGSLLPLKVDVQGASLSAEATLVRESAVVAEGQTGRLLFAAIDGGRRSGLRPGDFVQVTIQEKPLHGVFVLPAEAADTDQRLLVVGEEERLVEKPVRILRKQGNQIIVAADDLVGNMVVAQRSPVVGAGIRVRPILPENASVPDAPEDVELSEEDRAQLVAYVESNTRMPEAVKQRILDTLKKDKVPQSMIDRLRGGMGG